MLAEPIYADTETVGLIGPVIRVLAYDDNFYFIKISVSKGSKKIFLMRKNGLFIFKFCL